MKSMKRFCLLLTALLLLFCMTATVTAASLPRLDDGADLLTDDEEAVLLAVLDEISERQQFDVVVVTSDSLRGKTAAAYADDYFDDNGFGYGADYDGILLLVSMSEREWWISTSGYGLTAFTDRGIDDLAEEILTYLGAGDYATAFAVFAQSCDAYVTQARLGQPYGYDDDRGAYDNSYGYDDYGNVSYEVESSGPPLLAALAVGLIGAFVVTASMKSELKSVRKQNAAAYLKSDSMRMTDSRELFLYRNVSKTVRDTDHHSSSGRGGMGGGSSSHRSSSGRSHGGRGGRF